jgi:hypothetical protein
VSGGARPRAGPPATITDWSQNYWGQRFLTLFSPDRDSSYNVRQNIIGRYLEGALDRPFGSGTATTSYAGFAQEQFREAQASGAMLATGVNVPTDNNYFQVILEHGVVGELLLLLVLGTCLFFAVRSALIAPEGYLRYVAIGLAGCVAGAAVASFSNNYLNFWGTWVLFGLVCAVDQLVRAAREGTPEPSPQLEKG